jgi:hypothetical protein
MKLRYYADADVREWHDHAIRCLRSLQEEYDIAVEIDRIDQQHGQLSEFPGTVRQSDPETVYERDLKRNRTLNERIEQTPSEAYKRYGELEIAGNVAVVADDGSVVWASTLPGYADGYMPGVEAQTAMDFLDEITSAPSERFCVECAGLLDGSEQYCPGCGTDLTGK